MKKTPESYEVFEYLEILKIFLPKYRSAESILKYQVYNGFLLREVQLMKTASSLFYMLLFYTSLMLFVWNFESFSFQEKVIVGLLVGGLQCIASICEKEN